MKNSKEILSSVVKTAQMGQVGIRSVLDTSMRPSLRKALESQLREYDSIETEAHTIASQRGWELRELDPGVRMMTDMMTRMKLHGRNTDSKIADMMIQGNTKGMVKGLKNLHQFPSSDSQVQMVSQKLLDCETANIRQMQGFL
ncbi:MAG TPA: hypothetical protein DCO69_07990 [Clostridiales bacterium]|mgnify:FL=1|nr:hypothetical protein [Clostridiales bacterium]